MNDNVGATFLLDEGVPRSVGRLLQEEGFGVIFFHEAAIEGAPDPVIADLAMRNDAVLVALDGDMKRIARGAGVSKSRFKSLGLLKLSCKEPQAVQRIRETLPFMRLQLSIATENCAPRRLFAEIGDSWIRIHQQG